MIHPTYREYNGWCFGFTQTANSRVLSILSHPVPSGGVYIPVRQQLLFGAGKGGKRRGGEGRGSRHIGSPTR